MAQDSTLPLLVGLGAGAAALYFWQRKQRSEASPAPRDPWSDSRAVAPSPSAQSASTPPQTGASARPMPQLTGRWVWPTSFSRLKFCMFRAPIWKMSV